VLGYTVPYAIGNILLTAVGTSHRGIDAVEDEQATFKASRDGIVTASKQKGMGVDRCRDDGRSRDRSPSR
jgi:hypothetical protein